MSSSPEAFIPFNPEVLKDEGFSGPEAMDDSPAFQMSDTLWTTLMADPALKAELDRLIETRVGGEIRSRIAAGEAELRSKITQEARQEGLLVGRQEAAAEVAELRDEVTRVCQTVLQKGEARLNDHEELWIRSLAKLLKRFMVPNDAQIVSRIQHWLRESLEGLSERSEVRVYLATAQFHRLANHLGPMGRSWSWHEDPLLADGDIRCETEMGGTVFSPGDQWNRLEKIVEELLGETPIEIGELPKAG